MANKLTLKVLERMMLGMILPVVGNFVTVSTVFDIREKVKITASEMTKLSFQTDDRGTVWNTAADEGLEVEFSPTEYSLIISTLRDLDAKQALSIENVGLYKAFVAGPGATILPFKFPQKAPAPTTGEPQEEDDE